MCSFAALASRHGDPVPKVVVTAADSTMKGKNMSYEQVISAVKSNPALAAELAGSSSWADTEKILKANGVEVPANSKPTAEQEKELASIAGGGGTNVYFNASF